MRRALAANPDELKTRLAQRLYTARNRRAAKRGGSVLPESGHLHSLGVNEALLPEWFAKRKSRWFLTSERREELCEFYEEHELERSLILRRAQTVVEGKMPIFSREPVEFSGDDRWRRDFFVDVSAPQTFYGAIEYLNVAQVGDSKHVWEPNRFGWVYWLGQA